MITPKLYGQFFLNALSGKINWTSDTIKVMLCTNSYTPNQDTHAFKSDVTNEVVNTGYTAGGATLTNKTLGYVASTNNVVLDADDVTWSNSSITARYAVIYDATPATDATRPLIGYVDFGADVSSVADDFVIAWSSLGIVNVNAS